MGVVRTEYIASDRNLADLFTKAMKGPEFARILEEIVNFQNSEILGGHMYLSDIVRHNGHENHN